MQGKYCTAITLSDISETGLVGEVVAKPISNSFVLMAATLLYSAAALSLLVGTPLQQRGAAMAPTVQHRLPAVVAQIPAEKAYTKREAPPVLGGIKIGTRRVVVVTGASSGLGLSTTKALADQGYFVIAAVRNPEKMNAVAKELGIPSNSYAALKLELASLQSVKDFVANLKLFIPARPINHLICNAAVYRPTDPLPAFTDDGHGAPSRDGVGLVPSSRSARLREEACPPRDLLSTRRPRLHAPPLPRL